MDWRDEIMQTALTEGVDEALLKHTKPVAKPEPNIENEVDREIEKLVDAMTEIKPLSEDDDLTIEDCKV